MKKKYPIIPLKDNAFLPHERRFILIGRKFSINALKKTMKSYNNILILVSQKNDGETELNENSIESVGTIAKIIETQQISSDNFQIQVSGLKRVKINNFKYNKANECFFSEYNFIDPVITKSGDYNTIFHSKITYEKKDLDKFNELKKIYLKKLEVIRGKYTTFVNISIDSVISLEEPDQFLFRIINILVEDNANKNLLLGKSILEIMEWLLANIEEQIAINNLEAEISKKTQDSIRQKQEEYLLRERFNILKEIQGGSGVNDIDELRKKMKNTLLTEKVKNILEIEINKLNSMQSASSEYYVTKNYIENILEIPWCKRAEEEINIIEAQKTLDSTHFGLEKVKKEILKSISLFTRNPQGSPTILLLIGPPGVGKTSICETIAKAMKRPFGRISLAGMSDVARLQGHVKTYVASMPGALISTLKQLGVKNGVIQLDEIDKINQESGRDPMRALVALLDPEQNKEFKDNYVDIGFDCSEIMFILTGNYINNLPAEIIDRVKVIYLSGYTDNEKFQISDFIIKKEIERSQLKNQEITLEASAIKKIISDYTRESGVRNLQKQIRDILESVLLEINLNKIKKAKITEKNLKNWLGDPENTVVYKEPSIGVCRGLAWTIMGGDLLFIECASFPGKNELIVTGNLGSVMKESAQIVFNLIRSRMDFFQISKNKFKDRSLHLHVPEGAVPKEGPSAGITIFSAMLSLLLEKPIKNHIAMTGEVNLSGDVLKIGGLKEKLTAALRNHMKVVLIPKDNGLSDIPEELTSKLNIIQISHVLEAVQHIF